MDQHNVFVAFPSKPDQLGQTIELAVAELRPVAPGLEIHTWRQHDVAGQFLAQGILTQIDRADLVVADITRLNFNVTFEVGYAVGKKKKVLPILNSSMDPPIKALNELGLFDSIGYLQYENAQGITAYLSQLGDYSPLPLQERPINTRVPIFVQQTEYRIDTSQRILSRIERTGFSYRSYDPKEEVRLSVSEAFSSVSESVAVVVHLLSSSYTGFEQNNLRGAFLAGLSYGLGKEVLILQAGTDPVPADIRDFAKPYTRFDTIDKSINDLAPKVVKALRIDSREPSIVPSGLLEELDLGSPAAENEISELKSYYVATAEYDEALKGTIQLAVGRKGSGKTALFYRIRDKKRENRKNIVLDLKPGSHQLKGFKNILKRIIDDSVLEEFAIAFWEYVLLLEICHKLLERDKTSHLTDPNLFEPYARLKEVCRNDLLVGEGDFSERMLELVDRVGDQFTLHYGSEPVIQIQKKDMLEIIYDHDIKQLRDVLADYVQNKEEVWMLFDNIDKGWPTHGVEPLDIQILRTLLEANRKIKGLLSRRKVRACTIVFVRSDVYELLVDQSPDRGKETKVSLDWTDAELLPEFLRLRILYRGRHFSNDAEFDEVWSRICVSHVDGVPSAEYLIERSLMRPRNLLIMTKHCRSNAINLRHKQISEDDVRKAARTYSADIANDIGLEIRDVYPSAEDLPYYFIGAPARLNLADIRDRLTDSPVLKGEWKRVVQVLLWFGFLGVARTKGSETEETYIHDVEYDIKKLKVLASQLESEATIFCIHKAFRPFLEIEEQ